ncbi:hypothetical protein EC957_010976 [Mortierella hygrophila]|uniref:DUF4604 domain-containing protein n=1 Tax=Mortierella hygrophila TaxID=979708 RepID=A0A9P6FA62_9FUNG|nr:hypothetical protein EC957_010976 [Mortierella hygrophila]
MSNKKITPNQMRKNLTYVQEGAPDFMRMLTGQSASSAANNDPRNPYRKPIGIDAKFQSEQPSDDDDETAHDILNEREEERPTVVVLKESKHLDERQVKNILNNLPPGLSEAEIKKRLASALEENNNNDNSKEEDEEDSDEEDQDPVDANGKILFRRPKGSKSKPSTTTASPSSSTKSEKQSVNSSASKKNFETALLAEAGAKVQAIKKKQSGSSTAKVGTETTEGSKRKSNSNDNNTSEAPKKKKQQKKTATSLLSFNDDE